VNIGDVMQTQTSLSDRDRRHPGWKWTFILFACLYLTIAKAWSAPISVVQSQAWTAPAYPALGTITIQGDAPQLLLLQVAAGAGPAGVGDPVLTLLAKNERTVLATNDNWSSSAAGAVAIEAALTRLSLPALRRGSRDAALLVRLSPGVYAFKVMGKARTWERATVEAQLVPGSDLASATPLSLLAVAQGTRAQAPAPLLTVARITNKTLATAVDGTVRSDSAARPASNAFYHIGSCGKSVTATLAGLMVDEGKLRWDSTLAEVFPELANAMHVQTKAVTLEQLLAHRAGIGTFLVADEIAMLPTFTGTPKQQRLALVAHLSALPPASTVGDFSYSNGGVALAGAMIEKVSGKAYEELVRDRVMKPLGAEVVFGFPANASPKGRQTWGHITFGGTQLVHEPADPNFAPYNFPLCLTPAGLFSMTADGLARYVQMHLRGLRGESALLKPATFQYLHRPYGGTTTGYALGWEVRQVDGVMTSQHNGSLDPYFAQMAVQPARNAAAVAIASAADEAVVSAVEQATMLALGAPIGSAVNPTMTDFVVTTTPGQLEAVSFRSVTARDVPAQIRFSTTGSVPTSYLIRAIGPGLSQVGSLLPSASTQLILRDDSTQALIKLNSGWDAEPADAWPLTQAAASVQALPLRPGSQDSAFIVSLPAGRYSVSGAGDAGRGGEVRLEVHPLHSSFTADNVAALEESLAAIRTRYDRKAVATAVTRGADLLYSGGLGKANVETDLDATADTGFMIASISKTITATAVMQQVEQGNLLLDADISTYLPFTLRNPYAAKSPITVRQLLAHTSSITDNAIYPNYDQFYTDGADPEQSLAEFCNAVFNKAGSYYSTVTFARATPGTTYNYSNIGYALLGWIVERVAAQPFDQYCQLHIFTPLGMSSTSWRLADAATRPLAMPYSLFDEAYGHYTFADYPSGSVFTTANDLSRFMRAIMAGGSFNGQRILKSETVATMLTPAFPKVRDAALQGLGFFGFPLADGRLMWGHTGGEKGVATGMFFDPENQVGVIALMNKDLVANEPLFELLKGLLDWGTSQP